MSVGLAGRPSAATPADTAPELTTTTSWPSERARTSCWHSDSMTASSMTPSSSVNDDVPILTTMRTAQLSDWYSKLKPAIHTTSPSIAPARDSSRGTLSRLSWWSMYDSASGVVTSFSATTRSTCAAHQPELVVAEPLDLGAVGLGTDDDHAVVRRLLAARLVHERGHRARPARARPGA